MSNLNDFFNFSKVTEEDVKFYGAIPDTLKITSIKATENGIVNIPETIDGLPVTSYVSFGSCYGVHIKKLIVPKTLIALNSTENFPEVVEELVVDKDNPKWSTDGVSLLSKDGTRLLRMCQKNRVSYSVPDGVTTICRYSFEFNNNIEITIPDSVTTVEGSAFKFCHSLKTVHGGKNIVNYQSSSFEDTEWYKNSPILVLGTTLLRLDSMDENVVVPDGIEVIGPEAFYFRDDKDAILETVTLPATLKEIGESAFSHKTHLKAINFPEGLKTIKAHAFSGCSSLAEIILPDSIAEIGVGAFGGCSSISKITLPHSVSGTASDNVFCKEIENDVISAEAFSGCTALEYIEIPEGTVTIGASAFNYCSNLKSICIPNTVKKIGDKAFANCFELEQLVIPANCVEIGLDILPRARTGWGTKSAKLSRVDIDPQNEVFSSVDGIIYSKNADKIIACPSQYSVVDFSVPDGVKEILPGAFEGCEKIKKVHISQTVEKIDERAFASMNSLEEVIMPNDLPVIGRQVFEGCSKLKRITWPENVRQIGEKCFANTGIEILSIPSTVENIESYAFAFIKAKRVCLPQTVKTISLSIFAGVPEIEVYDTIDCEAKPATEYFDDMNGHPNGKVGFIGIHQNEIAMVAACNASWHEHVIIVRSSKDDSEKFKVRMPGGQKRKVYCTFASSWGRNAEFNFSAVDNIFKELTADAKLDYLLERLHYQEGITNEMLETLKKYVVRNAKDILARVFNEDSVENLEMLESFGIIKKNVIDEKIDEALKAKATQCSAWLIDWKNTNFTAKEAKKLNIGTLTVAEIKKIWPNKKGSDGGLIITGYNGKDIDVIVPEIIGKTPVTAIAENCFSMNKDAVQQEFLRSQLRKVVIPDSVKDIGYSAFGGCKGLEEVKLPSKMKIMSSNLYFDCSKLSIEIPDGIEEILDGVFAGCSMKSIMIPSSVEEISTAVFGTCRGVFANSAKNLEKIDVNQKSKSFKSIDGVLFSADGKTLIKYPQAKPGSEYNVPNSVVKISQNAFANAGNLKAVELPESVDIIEDDAFANCVNLEYISMPDKLSVLGSAFSGCTSLKRIQVPIGVTEILGACFSGCVSLNEVVLPERLKKIGFHSFRQCENLEIINIPNSVRGIGEKAFEGCTSLKTITVPGSVSGIGYGIFEGCNDLVIHTVEGSKVHMYAKCEKIKVVTENDAL